MLDKRRLPENITAERSRSLSRYHAAMRDPIKAEKIRQSNKRAGIKRRSNPEYIAREKERRIREYRRYQYGITYEQLTAWLKTIENKCESCGEGFGIPATFTVDHNHTTGINRGLLCHRCNVALGLLRESPRAIAGLLLYAKKHNCVRFESPIMRRTKHYPELPT